MKTLLPFIVPFCAFSFIESERLFAQGSLTPPGAPAPTMKTLDQIEPRKEINATNTPGDATCIFRITQPGSYYLSADLAGVAGKNGITITASRVTIDFRGLHAVGVSGSLSGVLCSAASDVTLTDGSVSSWGKYGVDMEASGTTACRLSRMTAVANSQGGFYLGAAAVVDDCVASNNQGFGFISGPGAYNRCVAYFNTGAGFSGGFAVSYNECVAEQNNGAGFTTSALCNLTQCIAGFNGAAGISVNNGSTVTNCTVLGNTGDGIACTFGAFILNNNCDQNGNGGGNGAGIHATGSDNRIDGNNCTQADRGIEANNAGNVIVRNTCATNTTDWVLAANNVFGAIVDRRAPASALVNGFTAASSLGSTDPWANVSY